LICTYIKTEVDTYEQTNCLRSLAGKHNGRLVEHKVVVAQLLCQWWDFHRRRQSLSELQMDAKCAFWTQHRDNTIAEERVDSDKRVELGTS
jgi:hypothetical protein